VLPPWVDAVSEHWWSLSPRVRAVVLTSLAIVALALVGRGATRSPWGPPMTVLVAAADVAPGSEVGPADVREARWPSRLVPADAFTGAPADVLPPGARARWPVPAGSVLTARHLGAGMAGLVGEGEAAVSVPRDELPAVAAGDVVDVIASDLEGRGTRVAAAARVLAADGAFLWLAVPSDRVTAVAAAGAAGRITLAVLPG
jgi:pilus assembly protein CpaB